MKKEVRTGAILYLVVFLLLLIIPQRHVHSEFARSDLVAHFFGFFFLYYALKRGLSMKSGWALLITFLVAVISEGTQYFIPWRNFSVMDFASDTAGIIFAAGIDRWGILLDIVISTFAFVGKIPMGPGTMAALITAIVVYALQPTFLFLLEGLSLIFLSGWIASSVYSTFKKEDDPKDVVIDEVTGQLTALLFVQSISVLNLLLAFVLFRLYDIIKPFGIKKIEKIGGGFAVMMDDEVAGVYAGLSLILIQLMIKKGGIL